MEVAMPAPNNFPFAQPEKWDMWLKRFHRYRDVSGLVLKTDKEQISMLVYCMGLEAEEILAGLPEESKENYDKIVDAFTSHFASKQKVVRVDENKNRTKLETRRQAPTETFPNYVAKMTLLVDSIGDLSTLEREELLLKRIVEGTGNKELKKRLQQEKNLTPQSAVEIARNLNLDGMPQPPLGRNDAKKVSDMKDHGTNLQPTSILSCNFCGGTFHIRSKCPAYRVKCSKCHASGHFPKMCDKLRPLTLMSKILAKPIVDEYSNLKLGGHVKTGTHHQSPSRKKKAKINPPPADLLPAENGEDDEDHDDLDNGWIIEDKRTATLYGTFDQFGITLDVAFDVSDDMDFPRKLIISDLTDSSQAQREKLSPGDFVLKIDNITAIHMTVKNALYVLQYGKQPHTIVVCSKIIKNVAPTANEIGNTIATQSKKKKKKGKNSSVTAASDDAFLQCVRDVFYTIPMELRASAAGEVLDVLERCFEKSQEAAKPKQEPNIETYLELLELENLAVIPNKNPFECNICMTDVEAGDGFILKECLHVFCKDCLKQLVENSEVVDIECPYAAEDGTVCKTVLTQKEIKALVSEEVFEKYLEKCLLLAEHQNANSYHCTTPDCRFWYIIEEGVDNFRCPVCMRVNCLVCKTIHDGLTCQTYKALGADNLGDNPKTLEMIGALLETNQAMRCPQCQVIVMKDDGCDAITCSCCKKQLCWATKGLRWGPMGVYDYSGGCGCRRGVKKCHPNCRDCH